MTVKNKVTTEIKDKELILSRLFDAPRPLVYQMLTDPKHFAQWWGPHLMANPICEMDVRIGGAYLIVMRGPDGIDYPMEGVYTEIDKNKRITFTAKLDHHPKAWHDMLKEKLNQTTVDSDYIKTISISLEDFEGKTKLSISTVFESDVIRDAFVKMGMIQGLTEGFEKLEKILK